MTQKYVEINGVQVDVTTVMKKHGKRFTPSSDQVYEVVDEFEEVTNTYLPNRLFEGNGLVTLFDSEDGVFWGRKGWILRLLEKMPGYNGRGQVIINSADYSRGIVFNHAIRALSSMKYECECRFIRSSDEEVCKKYRFAYHIFKRIIDIFQNEMTVDPEEVDEGDDVVDDGSSNKSTVNLISKDLVEYFNEIKPDDMQYNPREGNSVTKLVAKVARYCGLTDWTDLDDVSFYDNHGVFHEKYKDIGWNGQFAALGDAINPIESKYPLVISAHAVDYLTSSIGTDWSSCHTPDYRNIRNMSNSYNGMYMGGIMSYLVDTSSIVVYYLKELPEDGRVEMVPKFKRCMFHLGEDKIVQGRVYPDGRDGGDKSLAGDMRKVVQKLFADALGVPNYWRLGRGVRNIKPYVKTEGVNYEDYFSYNDCTISFLRRFDGYKNEERIVIGQPPICPECGEEHCNEGNIFCYDHTAMRVQCAGCGSLISECDANFINDQYYCDDCVVGCGYCGSLSPADNSEHMNTAYHLVYNTINYWSSDGNFEEMQVCDTCFTLHYRQVPSQDNRYFHRNNTVLVDGERFLNSDENIRWCRCRECGAKHKIENCTVDYTDIYGNKHYICNSCAKHSESETEATETQDDGQNWEFIDLSEEDATE